MMGELFGEITGIDATVSEGRWVRTMTMSNTTPRAMCMLSVVSIKGDEKLESKVASIFF